MGLDSVSLELNVNMFTLKPDPNWFAELGFYDLFALTLLLLELVSLFLYVVTIYCDINGSVLDASNHEQSFGCCVSPSRHHVSNFTPEPTGFFTHCEVRRVKISLH